MRLSLILLCVFCFVFSAQAQKKKTPTRKTVPPAVTTPVVNTSEVKDGANKVSIQIKNITKFVYLLGTIAQGIEDVDKDIQSKKASPSAIDINTKNKQAVTTTMRNLRAGIAALEVEFRTKQGLRPYLLQIQGITDLCGQAEDLANSGKLLDSGKPLLAVVEKLSDTLVAMP